MKYRPVRSDTCVGACLFVFRWLFVTVSVQNNQWDTWYSGCETCKMTHLSHLSALTVVVVIEDSTLPFNVIWPQERELPFLRNVDDTISNGSYHVFLLL